VQRQSLLSYVLQYFAVYDMMFCVYRKDEAYYDSLAAKAKAAAGNNDDLSDMSDADPGQLLREMV